MGSAPNTWTSYSTGVRHYITFCNLATRQTLPTTESTLLLFTAYLASLNLSHSSIKVYLSGVRSLHVQNGLHASFNKQLTPRLQQVLKGIRKQQAIGCPPRIRRPITIQIMAGIRSVLLGAPHSYHNIMMWAACCLAFFGFLRSSEFTVPSQGAFDKDVHLSPADIAIDNKTNPQIVRLTIKQSKTDPFRRGVKLYLGRTDSPICPVLGILPFLAVRGNRSGPLFILNDGRMLTRQLFSSFLDDILERLHLNRHHFNTHSFRIGAATSAKEAGIDDTHIKMLGRWRSDTYQQYIRTPPETFAKLSKALARTT